MTGLEVVVRPVVIPGIRPTAPRMLPPAKSTSSQTITGGGGQVFQLSYSYQGSTSHSAEKEIERVFDVDRIRQKNDDGTINEDNFVHVERVKKMKLVSKDGQTYMWDFALPPQLDNVSTILSDQVRTVVGKAISGEA